MREKLKVEIIGVIPNNPPCVHCHKPFTMIHWLLGHVKKTDKHESIHFLCMIEAHDQKASHKN